MLLRILMAVVVLFTSTTLWAEETKAPVMPDFTLSNQAGEASSLSDYQGQYVLLHFWATWCPYCKKVQPGLVELAEQHEQLTLVGISVREDPGTKPQDVLNARGHDFMTWVEGDQIAANIGVRGTPTTVLIGPEGHVLGVTQNSDPALPGLHAKLAELQVK